MTPIGSRHAATVAKIERLLGPSLPESRILWTQNPIQLGEFSQPEPDLALVDYRPDYYANGLPGPAAIHLVVEVADSSLAYDRGVKMPLYARQGVSSRDLTTRLGEQRGVGLIAACSWFF